jgi:hypothetical protein
VRLTREEADRVRHGAAPEADPSRVEPAPEPFPLPPGEPCWPIGLLAPDGELLALALLPPAAGGTMKLLRVVSGL